MVYVGVDLYGRDTFVIHAPLVAIWATGKGIEPHPQASSELNMTAQGGSLLLLSKLLGVTSSGLG